MEKIYISAIIVSLIRFVVDINSWANARIVLETWN